MQCPKCRTENAEAARFCTRCHAPLRFICPACKHEQDHGGQCESCGVDFAKYMTVMMVQTQAKAGKERARTRRRISFLREIVWLPITGGLSLLRYLFRQGDD